jgi:hypothetical protein
VVEEGDQTRCARRHDRGNDHRADLVQRADAQEHAIRIDSRLFPFAFLDYYREPAYSEAGFPDLDALAEASVRHGHPVRDFEKNGNGQGVRYQQESEILRFTFGVNRTVHTFGYSQNDDRSLSSSLKADRPEAD